MLTLLFFSVTAASCQRVQENSNPEIEINETNTANPAKEIGNSNVETIDNDDSGEEKTDMNREKFELVSAQEFKDYYKLNDEIPTDMIEGFIIDYNVTQERMEKYDMGKTISSIVSTGEDPNLGYHLNRIRSNGHISDKKIEEFIREAKWIYITFDFPNPEKTDYSYSENMVIDFKNKKIYFNSNEDNYRDAELSAELSDSEIEEIYEEFPQSVGDYTGEAEPCLDYSYHVYVIDGNKNQLNFNECVSDEDNIAFDNYWKNLYKQSFNKEYIKQED